MAETKTTRLSQLQVPVRPLLARFDAARTTDENRRHFANADGLGPNAAIAPEVRRILRQRARYEYVNNSYCFGIVQTIANDTVGTGPRLQMMTGDKDLDTFIEKAFTAHAAEIRLGMKLRMMRVARAVSGEAFALMANNPGLYHPVKLDIELIEPDQVANHNFDMGAKDNEDDGIVYDPHGNPVFYRVLKHHPGEMAWAVPTDSEDLPARAMRHYFRADRPGQRRGVPDITPAILLFAELRRFTSATIAAAETAANHAGIVYSELPPDDDDEVASPEAMDLIELTKRAGLVLPQGWKFGQMKAEHPTTTYAEFVDKKLEEIARCLNMPYTIAAMNAAKANMSAAYMDRQAYAADRIIDRDELEWHVDAFFDQWLNEARKIPGYLPSDPDEYRHDWFWPSLGHHADPQKRANAQMTSLQAGTTSYQLESSKDGLDWEQVQRQQADALGVSVDEYRALLRQKLFGSTTQTPGEDTDGYQREE